jgi:hypothetical protein
MIRYLSIVFLSFSLIASLFLRPASNASGQNVAPISSSQTGKLGFLIESIDSDGDVGQYVTLQLHPLTHKPIVAYYDADHGDLKYAYNASDGWHTEVVDSDGDVGQYASLALDPSSGYPRIAYFDATLYALKYATWNGTAWLITTVDTETAGRYASLALDPVTGYPRVSYQRFGQCLGYTAWDGTTWYTLTLDCDSGLNGYSTSLKLDPSTGYPRISYQRQGWYDGDLMYAALNGSSWSKQAVVIEGNWGWFSNLVINPTSGFPEIASYYPNINGAFYWRFDGTHWTMSTVENGTTEGFLSLDVDRTANPTRGYPRMTAVARTAKGQYLTYSAWDGSAWQKQTVYAGSSVSYNALVLHPTSGDPVIAFYDLTHHNLKLATWDELPATSLEKIHLGISLDLNTLDCLDAKAGRKHGIVAEFFPWQYNGAEISFPTAKVNKILCYGATPLIHWEPWDPINSVGIDLEKIAAGNYDAFLTRWASELKKVGSTVMVRWGQEMNGDWYPWGGNPTAYIAAWRHIHDLFAAQGATNVSWVWSINSDSQTVGNDYHDYYPGADYVDWVGVRGYNHGSLAWWSPPPGCRSFQDIFSAVLIDLSTYNKPLMISEFASACNNNCDKASWILDAYQSMQTYPLLQAVVWSNFVRYEDPNHSIQSDWRFDCDGLCSPSSTCPTCQNAYQTAIADPIFSSHPLFPVAACLTWANPADMTYGPPLSAAQLNATANVQGTFTYTPPAGTILNAGANQDLMVDFTPTDTTNYISASKTVQINILKATPLITWSNPADIIYGPPLSVTQLNATANTPGTFTYTPPLGTVLNAGNGQDLKVDFGPTDTTNYTSASKTVQINVLKATPTLTWANPADIPYGVALSAIQLNATANVPGTFIYTPAIGTVLNAGNHQDLKVDFTPTDTTNYAATSKTVQINVLKVTPIITWANPADISYGVALSAIQLNATANVPGTLTYTPGIGAVLNAGNHQDLKVDFTPADTTNYAAASKTVKINVLKATPLITWANPTDIVYGPPLSAAQLNATANIPGTFTYTPPAGTVLNAGNGKDLKVDFTPTDTQNYDPVSKTVQINVLKATPTLTWANPADISYGVALSAIQLNATGNVPGTFTYNPAAGTVLNAGNGQDLKVDFVPTDTTNYTSASKTVQINVLKTTPVITWANPADIPYGVALSAIQLNATANVPGTFTYTPAAGTVLHAGKGQDLKADFTPADTTNYAATSKTVQINVLSPIYLSLIRK